MMAGIAAFSVLVHHILVWCFAINVRFVDTTSKKALEMFTFTSHTFVCEIKLSWS
jgi:hypothetical protein